MSTGKWLWWKRSDGNGSGCFTFTPDSRALIIAEQDNDLSMYRVDDGALASRFPLEASEPIQALAFSRNGKELWLATDKTLIQYQS